jgi:cyclopropane fatty-acyl-phospholipid synthase-like methyltransferase
MTDPRIRVVGQGYDAIADRFAAWSREIVGDPRHEWVDALASRLRDGARVLELGCGAGTAETQRLAERFEVTGVDVSATQLERARANVPGATFVHGDFTSIELESESVDAVLAVYSFNHVPRDLLAPLFGRVHGWLAPGGLFLVSLGAGDTPDWTGEWLGTTMFFSGFPPAVNRVLLESSGFELVLDDVVHLSEPEGEVAFHWILAQR